MTQQNPVQKDTQLHKQVAELQKRVDVLEDILDSSKEVLTVEEAAKFMGMARSSLYKMTCEQSIPFDRTERCSTSRTQTFFRGFGGTGYIPKKRLTQKPVFTCKH